MGMARCRCERRFRAQFLSGIAAKSQAVGLGSADYGFAYQTRDNPGAAHRVQYCTPVRKGVDGKGVAVDTREVVGKGTTGVNPCARASVTSARRRRGCQPSAPPARAALAEQGAERIAGDPAGAIAAIVAPRLAVVVPAVDPRSVVIAVHPRPQRGHEPEADARNVGGTPGARGLRHFAGFRRGRVAGHRDLRRSARRGRQEARAGCQSGDKDRPARWWHVLLVFIVVLLARVLPQRRVRRKVPTAEHAPSATKWPRVVPLLRDPKSAGRGRTGEVLCVPQWP